MVDGRSEVRRLLMWRSTTVFGGVLRRLMWRSTTADNWGVINFPWALMPASMHPGGFVLPGSARMVGPRSGGS